MIRSLTKKSWLALSIAVILAMVLAACGGDDEEEPTPAPTRPPAATATTAPAPTTQGPTATPAPTPTPAPTSTPTPRPIKTGGTFNIRISGAFGNEWDTYSTSGQFSAIILQNLLNNLTYIDAVDGSTIRTDLVERYSISADGKTITYNLRRDVKWHNGAPFTSKDVNFSFTRAKNGTDPKAQAMLPRLRSIQSFAAPDDYTFTVTLSQPSASIIYALSTPFMLMYSADSQDVQGAWKQNPIGTGPFKYKKFEANVVTEFVKNPDYWKKDAAGRATPYLDGITYQFITDQALTFAAFRAGRLDCTCGYSSDMLPEQKDEARKSIPNVKIGNSASMNILFFGSRGPLANAKVRQAISVAIDRKTIADIVRGGGLRYPPTWLVPEKMGGKFTLTDAELLRTPGFRLQNNAKDPADFELSKRLFQEAGVDPASLNLVVIGVPQQADYTEALVTLLGKAGIKTTLQVIAATADRTARLLRNDFDIGTAGGGQTLDDPYDQIVNYISSTGANNYGKLANPDLDKLLTDQEQTLDFAKRRDMVWDLQRRMFEWATFVPFAELTTVFGAHPYVENLPVSRAFVVTSAHKFENVWLNK